MGSQADVSEIPEHAGFNVAGHLASLDVHGGDVDLDPGIGPLIHGFVRSGVISDLRAQILDSQCSIHTRVVSAVSHDLLLIVLQDLRIIAHAFDEQNAITELAGEVIVDLRALRSRDQHGVQELETGKSSRESDGALSCFLQD